MTFSEQVLSSSKSSAGRLEPGTMVNGKYEIKACVGAGAHGVVYKAVQHPVGRLVALKFINRHLSAEADNRRRFFNEARVLASLSNNAVVTLFDYGEANGCLFMVMEYLEGRELKSLIAAEAPMNAARVSNITGQVLAALIEAHELGLVHRDLKPANIMVTRSSTGEEKVKILDFGIAALRRDHHSHTLFMKPQHIGTPGYCAPEQSMGQTVGPSADLYALGVMMFEMITGKAPFTAPTAWLMLERHINEPVPRLGQAQAGAFESIVRLAMAKPDARFPDARMLRRLLEVSESIRIDSDRAMPTMRDLPVLRILENRATAKVNLNRGLAVERKARDIMSTPKRTELPAEIPTPRHVVVSDAHDLSEAGLKQSPSPWWRRDISQSTLRISLALNGAFFIAFSLLVTSLLEYA